MTMHRSTFDRLIPGALASSAVTGVALVAAALLCVPAALTAQAHISGDHEPHLFAAADSGNGLSPVLDPFEHTFLNADLSVHVQGEPIDGWVGMQARTWIDARGAGVAHSALWSTEGPLGHALQSLVVRRAR